VNNEVSQVFVVGEALMDLIPVSGGVISEMVGGGHVIAQKP
jgi:hypothetical protein